MPPADVVSVYDFLCQCCLPIRCWHSAGSTAAAVPVVRVNGCTPPPLPYVFGQPKPAQSSSSVVVGFSFAAVDFQVLEKHGSVQHLKSAELVITRPTNELFRFRVSMV